MAKGFLYLVVIMDWASRAVQAAKCSPSPTSPQAPQPTQDSISMI
jgi:hypothetical protein